MNDEIRSWVLNNPKDTQDIVWQYFLIISFIRYNDGWSADAVVEDVSKNLREVVEMTYDRLKQNPDLASSLESLFRQDDPSESPQTPQSNT